MTDYNEYKIVRKVRDGFILALRAGFSLNDTYKWSKNKNDTRISIVDAAPLSDAELPAIVVTSASGTEQRYLGPDYLEEDDDQQDVRFVSIPVTIGIKTYNLSPIDRDELGDLIFQYLKIATEKLAELGVEIQRIQIGGDTRQFLQDRWWFSGNYTIITYTEWVHTAEEEFLTVEDFTVTFNEQLQL